MEARMKIIKVMLIFVIFFAPLQGRSNTKIYSGELKPGHERYALVQKALTLLEGRYSELYKDQPSPKIPIELIRIVDDLEKFIKDFSKSNGVSFSKTQIEEMKTHFMTTIFYQQDRYPMFLINARSQLWQTLCQSEAKFRDMGMVWYQDFSATALAAGLDHEIVFHYLMNNPDEIRAHQHERESFASLAKKFGNPELLKLAEDYLKNLDLVIAQLQQELILQEQKRASAMLKP